LARSDGPLDAQARIGPVDAAVMISGIDLVDLIEDYTVGFQRAEAVCKPCRNQQLISRLLAQLDRQMLAVGGGRASQVDDNIENSPAQHPKKLGLSKRRYLEVQPANGSRGT